MERPRLRPLEAFPIDKPGQKLLGLRDPSGLTDSVATLPPAAVAVVQLCDGDTTRDEICAEFFRRYGSPLARARRSIGCSSSSTTPICSTRERFRNHSASLFGEFARSPVRARACWPARAIPATPAKLAGELDALLRAAARSRASRATLRPLPRAIIAPHIDFARGGPAYAWAYRRSRKRRGRPELVVVFGTDHNGAEQPFTLTRKHYETPLGAVRHRRRARRPAGRALRRAAGPAPSQALFKRRVSSSRRALDRVPDGVAAPYLGARADVDQGAADPVRLAAGLHRLGARSRAADRCRVFFATLDDERGRAASAPVDRRRRSGARRPALRRQGAARRRRRDVAREVAIRQTLRRLRRGDAAAWFEELRKERDRRRVCGLPPIFAMLECAQPGTGELAVYAQCPADESGGSLVSIASLVYR